MGCSPYGSFNGGVASLDFKLFKYVDEVMIFTRQRRGDLNVDIFASRKITAVVVFKAIVMVGNGALDAAKSS